jgi:hypothetical protein
MTDGHSDALRHLHPPLRVGQASDIRKFTHRHIGTSAHWNIGTSAHPHIRTLEHWHIRTSAPALRDGQASDIRKFTHRHIGPSAHWNIGTSAHSAHPHIRTPSGRQASAHPHNLSRLSGIRTSAHLHIRTSAFWYDFSGV